jgi:histidyl-tRNA synthetase
VPCVGVSIGVERVFAIMEANLARANNGALTRTPPSVMVASIPSKRMDMNTARMGVCAHLWGAGFAAEMAFSDDPKLQKQVASAAEGGVPFMVVLGEDEVDKGLVQVKDMAAREAHTVPREQLVATLLRLGAKPVSAGVGSPAAIIAKAAAAASSATAAAASAPAAAAAAGAAATAAPEPTTAQ